MGLATEIRGQLDHGHPAGQRRQPSLRARQARRPGRVGRGSLWQRQPTVGCREGYRARTSRGSVIPVRYAAVYLLGLLALMAGCQRDSAPASRRIGPNPRAPAAYGPPTGVGSKEIARARAPGAEATRGPSASSGPGVERAPSLANWAEFEKATLAVLQTELSPAILI